MAPPPDPRKGLPPLDPAFDLEAGCFSITTFYGFEGWQKPHFAKQFEREETAWLGKKESGRGGGSFLFCGEVVSLFSVFGEVVFL